MSFKIEACDLPLAGVRRRPTACFLVPRSAQRCRAHVWCALDVL